MWTTYLEIALQILEYGDQELGLAGSEVDVGHFGICVCVGNVDNFLDEVCVGIGRKTCDRGGVNWVIKP